MEAASAPEPAPIARSSIAPLPPCILVEGWEVTARRSSAGLRLVDVTPLAKVLVRADAHGEVARVLDAGFGRVTRNDYGTLVVGSGPGEWLLFAPPGTASTIAARIGAAGVADNGLVTVADVTHGGALVRLVGAPAARVLGKLCPVDLSERTTPDRGAFRSWVANVATDVVRSDWRGERSYLLHCARSYGQYLFDALLDAGHEFGIEVDGFVTPGI